MTLAESLLEGYGYITPSSLSDIGEDPISYLQEACIEAINALYEASQQYYIGDIIGQAQIVQEGVIGDQDALLESVGSKIKDLWEKFKAKVKQIIDAIVAKIRKVIAWIKSKFNKKRDKGKDDLKKQSSTNNTSSSATPTTSNKSNASPTSTKSDDDDKKKREVVVNMPNGDKITVDVDKQVVPIPDVLNELKDIHEITMNLIHRVADSPVYSAIGVTGEELDRFIYLAASGKGKKISPTERHQIKMATENIVDYEIMVLKKAGFSQKTFSELQDYINNKIEYVKNCKKYRWITEEESTRMCADVLSDTSDEKDVIEFLGDQCDELENMRKDIDGLKPPTDTSDADKDFVKNVITLGSKVFAAVVSTCNMIVSIVTKDVQIRQKVSNDIFSITQQVPMVF